MMRMSITVDGFVGGPNGENDWVFKSSDETSRAAAVERFREAGLIIMGRKSFESLAPYWPTANGPFAPPMNEIPKAVFTKKDMQASPLVRISRLPRLPGPKRGFSTAILRKG